MSQIGVFIPCHGADGADCVKQSTEAAHCYTGLRVVKLRDRTGPSVAERLAAVEDRLRTVETDEIVTKRLNALEEHLRDHQTRIGDLEDGDPAPVRPEPGSAEEPTPEQIEAYTWESPDWRRDREDDNKEMGHAFWHEKNGGHLVYPRYRGALEAVAAAEGVTPAEMRARILGARCPRCDSPDPKRHREVDGEPNVVICPQPFHGAPATADPDRLAKVAFAANGAVGWERMPHLHDHYRAIAAAVAEACDRERDALLARAEKAERELAKWVQEACDVGAALKPYRAPLTAAFVSRADDIRSLVADWQKRGEELEAVDAALMNWRPAVKSLAERVVGLLASNDGRAVEIARLREVIRGLESRSTPKPTAPEAPRNRRTDPQPGDWFVDLSGCVRAVTDHSNGRITFTSSDDSEPRIHDQHGWTRMVEVHGMRPMAPSEIAAFKANATRPTSTPSEAEMAAELREAGWHQGQASGQWYLRPSSEPHTTADAHAAMRAAKGAK